MPPDTPIVHDVQAAKRLLAEMQASGRLKGVYHKPRGLSIFTAHNFKRRTLVEHNLLHLGIDDFDTVDVPVKRWTMTARIEWFLKYFETRPRDIQYILHLDADDVVLQADPAAILEIFQSFDCDLLYGTTRWRIGYKCMPEVKRWVEKTHPHRYLNAGVFIGRRDFLIDVYSRVMQYVTDCDVQPKDFYAAERRFAREFPRGIGCDQTILRYLEPDLFPRLKVDTDGRFVWRNDNRTRMQSIVSAIKRSVPIRLKQPIKKRLTGYRKWPKEFPVQIEAEEVRHKLDQHTLQDCGKSSEKPDDNGN